jgi:O-antigen/teichoic acid export membrane protein
LSEIAAGSRTRRFFGLATGFGALHVAHTGLNLAFTLVQLLVLARGLDQARYAEVVFLTAVGFYVQPIDQAIGRANYMALRPLSLGVAGETGGEVFRFLAVQALLLTVLSFLVPAWFGLDDPVRYLGNALYLFGCLFTAYWSFDLQSTVWGADLGRRFAFISIIRRLLFIAALGLFLMTGSFLAYGVATTVVVIAFMAVLARMLDGSPIWSLRAAPVTRGGVVAHWKRFWSSLVFALSELFVLNSPYAVVTALLGVGPALVMFDSVMKVCRLAMAGTRTLAEVFLPRISRQLLGGEMPKARRGLALVIALCVAASAVPALAVLFFGQAIFDLLLGPNNVVPPQAAPAAALIVLISGFYQPATLFLSYLNAARLIRRVAQIAFLGAAAYVLLVWATGAEPVALLWIYAAFFAAVSLVSVICSRRIEPWDSSPMSDRHGG